MPIQPAFALPACSRRSFLKGAFALAGAGALSGLGLAGCGGSAQNGELNLFTWPLYVPDDVIDGFESKAGVEVKNTTYSTNEDMLAKFKLGNEGTYDLIQPTGYMVARMRDEGLLQKIDTSRLENFGNLSPSYLNRGYDPNNEYSIPYMASATAIVYDSDTYSGADVPTSWADLLDPRFEGQIAMVDNALEFASILCAIMGEDFSQIDASYLGQIRELALQMKPNIVLYDADCVSPLANGDATVACIYTTSGALAQNERPSIAVSFPEEGINLAIDNWAIPATAKNLDNVYAFIDYVLDPEVAASVTALYPYLQPNEAAMAYIDSSYVDNEATNVPQDIIAKAHVFNKAIDSEVTSGVQDIWNEIKS